MLQRVTLFLFLILVPLITISGQVPRKGVLQIKIAPIAEPQIVKQSERIQTTTMPTPLNLGMQQFDAVNRQFNASGLRRVFPDAGEYEALHRKAGLHLWYEIKIEDNADLDQAIKAYADLDEVESAGMLYPIVRISSVTVDGLTYEHSATPQSTTSDDPYYKYQWHYKNTGTNGIDGVAGMDISLNNAWDKTQGDEAVIVAIVDGGIDYRHPDLAGNMWSGIGYNFVSNSSIVTADDHGTHVAGSIAALTNNSLGVASIAGGSGTGDGVRLMSCQIFEGNSGGSAANAILFAADNGAVISQNSWGYDNPDVYNKADSAAIIYFIENAGKNPDGTPRANTKMVGGIVIFAAGNNNADKKWYPGYFDFVTTVASVGSKGTKAYYSNYGSWVDITAPGGDFYNTGIQGGTQAVANRGILSTIPTNSSYSPALEGGYGSMQGTSMACPQVSGIAGLVLSRFGSSTYTPAMLQSRLINAVKPLDDESYYQKGWMGAGLIDAAMAVADNVPVTGINLPETENVYIGRKIVLTPALIPANATEKRVSWSTANEGIASVDSRGNVIGVALGSTTITATSIDGGYKANTTIMVVPIPVDGVIVTPASVIIKPGESRTLQATISPVDATNKIVQWESADEMIATVDNTGKIWAESIGTTRITATSNDGSYSSSSTITVVQPVTGVAVEPSRIRLLVGDTLRLIALIHPEDAYYKQVSWSTDNPAVVSVNSNGKVQTKALGNSKVTVKTTDGGYMAYCIIDVFDNIQAPEGFSPNGDGINDYFELTLDSRDVYALVVMDKSGQLCYQSTDYRNNWDGMASTGPYSGSKLPAGTYFYVITGKSGDKKSGYVILKY